MSQRFTGGALRGPADVRTKRCDFPMNAMKKLTWLAVIATAAGCALQKVQRTKYERLARKAAGEGAYERTHPHSVNPVPGLPS